LRERVGVRGSGFDDDPLTLASPPEGGEGIRIGSIF
jgi:hypothetical protein